MWEEATGHQHGWGRDTLLQLHKYAAVRLHGWTEFRRGSF